MGLRRLGPFSLAFRWPERCGRFQRGRCSSETGQSAFQCHPGESFFSSRSARRRSPTIVDVLLPRKIAGCLLRFRYPRCISMSSRCQAKRELASVKRAPLIREPPSERNLIIGEVHSLPGRAPTLLVFWVASVWTSERKKVLLAFPTRLFRNTTLAA